MRLNKILWVSAIVFLTACSAQQSSKVEVSCKFDDDIEKAIVYLNASAGYDDGFGYSIYASGTEVARISGRSAVQDNKVDTVFDEDEILTGKFWSSRGAMKAEHTVSDSTETVLILFEDDIDDVEVTCR